MVSMRTEFIRPGKLDYLFLIHKKNQISMRAGGHVSLFIIKKSTPNQAVKVI